MNIHNHDHSATVITQRGLYYEEFVVGATYQHAPGRTATEADNVLFTTLTMNTQALHLDEHVSAQQEPFHARVINSMWTLSTMVGISVTQLTQGTLVAQLQLTDINFPHPLFVGDTLYVQSRIVEKRPSRSRPGTGICVIEHTGTNQEGTVVAQGTRTCLMRMQPSSDR